MHKYENINSTEITKVESLKFLLSTEMRHQQVQ